MSVCVFVCLVHNHYDANSETELTFNLPLGIYIFTKKISQPI